MAAQGADSVGALDEGSEEWARKLASELSGTVDAESLGADFSQQLVNAGLLTSASAQLLLGGDAAAADPDLAADSEVGNPALEASFLASVKDLLQGKRADLLAEVRPAKAAEAGEAESDKALELPPLSDEEPIDMPVGGKRRTLAFDTDDMYVDDLREECSMRGLPTSGAKAVVIKRLADAVASRPELSAERLTWHTRKRKRQMNKREPERSEFGSEAEFAEAWEKWRQIRDQNNESVKRSRENSRAKKLEHDRLCEERERENSELTSQVQKLREQVTFLTKVLQTEHLSEEDEERVASLMGPLLEMDRQREEGQAGAEDGVAE